MGYTLQEFTSETGEQTMIDVNKNHDVTVIVKAGSGDDVDLEIAAKNGAERHKLVEGITNQTLIKTLDGPINEIGLDIDTNVSNNISLEVLTAYRGG